jgi:hypothetical protein
MKEITWAGKGHKPHCKCCDCLDDDTVDDEIVRFVQIVFIIAIIIRL